MKDYILLKNFICKCNFCDKKYNCKIGRLRHENQHNGKSFACRFCDNKCTQLNNAKQHEIRDHAQNQLT